MYLSRRSNGIFYLWWIDEYGRRHKVSTKSRIKSEALNFIRNFREKEYERELRIKRLRLSQFIGEFLSYSKGIHTPKTHRTFRSDLGQLLQVLGDLPLHKIGVREIERFLSSKKAQTSDWTARRCYTSLSSALETAKRWGYIATNPFRSVEKPRAAETQPTYFSKPDFQTLLSVIPEIDFRELCICAVLSGMRLGELRALQWTDVDFVRKVMVVQNREAFTTKNKKIRVVPMNEQLWRMLATRKERASCELVFHRELKPMTESYISHNLKRAVRGAGLDERLHFHSLRHSFATWLVQGGATLYEVQKLLGHSDVGVTQVYSHLAASELHSVVSKISLGLN